MTWERPEGTDASVNCGSAIDELYHYLDGELTDERRRQITEHLDYCAPCAGAAGFEAELRLVIADRCKDRVPDTLRVRIAALIEAEGASAARLDGSKAE
jgi:mycothiol system anti-sigma-R factor